MTALDRLTVGPFVSRRREVEVVERELSELAVKAPSLEAPVSSLSGGNQQKVVMARAMLSRAGDPASPTSRPRASTSARAPRSTASCARSPTRGVPVVVASSDALELEGLCDRVIVMSRGQAVATLEGDDVTEERIVHAAISATAHTARAGGASARAAGRGSRASSRATTRRSSILAAGDARARRLRPGRRTAATSRTSTSPP